MDLMVACADIGSVANKRFAWYADTAEYHPGHANRPEMLAAAVSGALTAGRKVALGFECPLFVPIDPNPLRLTSARTGEGRWPWCAGAGSSALAAGLT
jgi:hypothetical protein